MKRFIKINREQVEVNEEIYKEYYKMTRHNRYLEKDIKVGCIKIDQTTGQVSFQPSKEDSIERLMDMGKDFEEEKLVEDVIVDKAMLLILQEAMKELNYQEQELINDLFYKELTVREVAKKENVSHVAIIKRRDKIINKLKKFF